VLDGTLAGPAAHRALLARLAGAGLSPLYRRFDPRLTEADLVRFPVIVWLGGRVRGTAGSLAVSPDEVERAVRFVREGGRLVLGVPRGPAVGGAEGRAMQAVLDRLGVAVSVAPHEVVDLDPAASYAAALMRAPLFAPDPEHPLTRGLPARIVGARSAPLEVGPTASALLRTLPTAFLDRLYGPPPAGSEGRGARAVAASARLGDRGGRVFVLPRDLLGVGGSLAGATFEPLLPERLPPGALEGRERFLEALLRDAAEGLGAAAPAGRPRPAVDPGRARRARDAACRPRVGERWLVDEGVRAGWGYVDRAEPELAALLGRLPASGLNVLWGPAEWDVVPDSGPARFAARARDRARRIDGALRGTPVRWLAGIHFPGAGFDPARYAEATAIGGARVGLPSPVDDRFWEEVVLPRLSAVAREATEAPALAGLVIDLEMYHQPILYYGDAFEFGDAAFGGFLDEAALAEGEHGAARRLRPAERGDWLLATARLPAYYRFLERRAERIGRRLREALDKGAPGRDLVLGFYAVGVLPSWLYRGLWRGASAGGRPVLLLTFQTDVAADLEEAAWAGACLRHALAALLGLAADEGLAPLLARAAREHDGFWLNRVTTLVAPPAAAFEAIEAPGGRAGDAAWSWVRDGVEAYRRARRR
jgi:hypothetical protein